MKVVQVKKIVIMSDSSSMIIVGVDECGRGCLFGKVVAAAVILPTVWPDNKYLDIKDSKKLTKKKREELSDYIKQHVKAYGIGEASVEEIDRVNILQATMKAMHRALDQVYRKCPFTKIHVDGTYFTPYLAPGADDDNDITHTTIVQGDDKDRAIAAASIIAKVARDQWVQDIVSQYPEYEVYGLKTNMGYGTKVHIEAIRQHGMTPFHRRTFQVKQLMT
jgi:ribonuclease HII